MNVILVKSKIKFLILFVLLFFCVACSMDSQYKESVPVTTADIDEDYEAVYDDNDKALKSEVGMNQVPADLKIIKSANARYKVEDVKITTRKIKRIAQKYGAYISDLRFENNLYQKENRFTIKIPQQHFDAMMDSIGFMVEFVEYENITTKDVTEEYIDIQTRLETKKEVKSRYESILRESAITVEDILATEDKLRIIQEEIESAQGRLKYLTNKVSYSTIQIDLYETVEYTEEPESYSKTFFAKGKEGLSNGWTIIESFILGLIYVWPLVIIGVIVYFVVKKKIKNRKA
ncbi:DUF4349 domain-containing protein [Psychroserpens luteolus]|uniref:DUF4349 domain-containing protein n=1 Tax=Psychroserpens luteolus TaxID=2855840 RepID=UPI001E64830B|nr:DUF4349 domain-containing protein [Psychroserpens luteolus]MCD2259745.1 DUF4349 domain-containing protein [Psychroserpens luteolus]